MANEVPTMRPVVYCVNGTFCSKDFFTKTLKRVEALPYSNYSVIKSRITKDKDISKTQIIYSLDF